MYMRVLEDKQRNGKVRLGRRNDDVGRNVTKKKIRRHTKNDRRRDEEKQAGNSKEK